MGQLLARGYEQELSNGKHLRQAYFYDGVNTAEEHAAADPFFPEDKVKLDRLEAELDNLIAAHRGEQHGE